MPQITLRSEDVHVAPATPEDREWAARVMASSDPWLTLGRGLEHCRDALPRPRRTSCSSPGTGASGAASRCCTRAGCGLALPRVVRGRGGVAQPRRGRGAPRGVRAPLRRIVAPLLPLRLVLQHPGARLLRAPRLPAGRRVRRLRRRRRLRDPDVQAPGAGGDGPRGWWLVALLCGTATASYLCRVNVSVVGVLLMRELALDQVQMGRVFSAFLLGYALMQVPGGMVADRWGARRVLTAGAWWWVAATLLQATVGWWPVVSGGAGALALLLAARFVLGVGEAPDLHRGGRGDLALGRTTLSRPRQRHRRRGGRPRVGDRAAAADLGDGPMLAGAGRCWCRPSRRWPSPSPGGLSPNRWPAAWHLGRLHLHASRSAGTKPASPGFLPMRMPTCLPSVAWPAARAADCQLHAAGVRRLHLRLLVLPLPRAGARLRPAAGAHCSAACRGCSPSSPSRSAARSPTAWRPAATPRGAGASCR